MRASYAQKCVFKYNYIPAIFVSATGFPVTFFAAILSGVLKVAFRRLVRLITPSSLALRPGIKKTKESLGKIFKKTPMDCEEPSPTLAFQHAVLL